MSININNINPVRIVYGIIISTMILTSIKYGIGFVEIVSHVYQKNNDTISQAIFISNNLPCNNSDILMKWQDINDFCKQWTKISKRSIIWETIVESSDYFHICYVKKHVHDESKKFGHSHASENDLELDCSYLIYFILVIFILSIFLLFVYFKLKSNNIYINKQKNE